MRFRERELKKAVVDFGLLSSCCLFGKSAATPLGPFRSSSGNGLSGEANAAESVAALRYSLLKTARFILCGTPEMGFSGSDPIDVWSAGDSIIVGSLQSVSRLAEPRRSRSMAAQTNPRSVCMRNCPHTPAGRRLDALGLDGRVLWFSISLGCAADRQNRPTTPNDRRRKSPLSPAMSQSRTQSD